MTKIGEAAGVDSYYYDWRNGSLDDESLMSARVEKVLLSETRAKVDFDYQRQYFAHTLPLVLPPLRLAY